MNTTIIDRYGMPYLMRVVRQRMGFLPGTLDCDYSEPPMFQQPATQMPELDYTGDGANERVVAGGKYEH